MLDLTLRRTKDRLLGPAARLLAGRVPAGALTLAALVCCVGAAVLAALDSRWLAVAAWLLGRLLDGLDGPVARARDRQSALGGYLDMLGDTVGYAAVPIGVAFALADTTVWAWCAVLLGTFFVNTISWTYLAAIAEQRQAGASAHGESTTIHMPGGLVEGTETIVLFTLMLAWPALAPWWFGAMAIGVVITVAQRVRWAVGNL